MDNVRQVLVKNGVHIGAQRKVKPMRKFVFKVREDGLAIINIQNTIDRMKVAAKMICNYPAGDVLVVSGKEQAEKPAVKFAEYAKITYSMGRFMPGTMTNPSLDYFIEPKLLIATDPYVDRQAIKEAIDTGIPVICLASSNNLISNVDLVIPCNNKGKRSLAAVFWALTNFVLFEQGELKADETIDEDVADFMSDIEAED